jgi:hypothetical protein
MVIIKIGDHSSTTGFTIWNPSGDGLLSVLLASNEVSVLTWFVTFRVMHGWPDQ